MNLFHEDMPWFSIDDSVIGLYYKPFSWQTANGV